MGELPATPGEEPQAVPGGEHRTMPGGEPHTAIAVLKHLSGPSLGLETLLYGNLLNVILSTDRRLEVAAGHMAVADGEGDGEGGAGAGAIRIARLVRTDGSYRLEASGGPVWINGRQVEAAELIEADVIEFGEKGPLSRFHLMDTSAHARRYFSEICDDCWDYLRVSRKPLPQRLANAAGEGLRRLLRETTLLFRIGVIAALALFGFVAYQQHQISSMLEAELRASQGRIENVATAVARGREQALTAADLEAMRDSLSRGLGGRLEVLEQQSRASETVIGASTASVAFLQGAFGFREAASGLILRHRTGPDGTLLAGPDGSPLMTLSGDGPPAERVFTGTGFAIADGSVLATNRHVAVPWEDDEGAAAAQMNGLEPFMLRMIAYSPGSATARQVELLQAADDADLALLRLAAGEAPLAPLPLAADPIAEGEFVIVMGYPTGLRSMVVRAGEAFVEELQRTNETDFWNVARQLAQRNLITPLSSRGIVAQLTSAFLVYDAATTRGGSGGPVLNMGGEVVAVNAAILPEYGGSNLGVPIAKLHELIAAAQLSPRAALGNQ